MPAKMVDLRPGIEAWFENQRRAYARVSAKLLEKPIVSEAREGDFQPLGDAHKAYGRGYGVEYRSNVPIPDIAMSEVGDPKTWSRHEDDAFDAAPVTGFEYLLTPHIDSGVDFTKLARGKF